MIKDYATDSYDSVQVLESTSVADEQMQAVTTEERVLKGNKRAGLDIEDRKDVEEEQNEVSCHSNPKGTLKSDTFDRNKYFYIFKTRIYFICEINGQKGPYFKDFFSV